MPEEVKREVIAVAVENGLEPDRTIVRPTVAEHVDSRVEADRIFAGLSAGGAIEMPMGDSPWGSYFGMFRDRFGIEWTIEFAGE